MFSQCARPPLNSLVDEELVVIQAPPSGAAHPVLRIINCD
jgi:hypothetical protein